MTLRSLTQACNRISKQTYPVPLLVNIKLLYPHGEGPTIILIPRCREEERCSLPVKRFSCQSRADTTDLDSVLNAQGRHMTPTSSSIHLGKMGVSDAGGSGLGAKNREPVLYRVLCSLTDITTP